MIALTEDAWKPLKHAYGTAENIPALLLTLVHYPQCRRPDDEPWSSLWDSLYHQGDTYNASIAAVPHILMIAEAARIEAGRVSASHHRGH
jgi:hypothetical protein